MLDATSASLVLPTALQRSVQVIERRLINFAADGPSRAVGGGH
jgi:hypothetical protein